LWVSVVGVTRDAVLTDAQWGLIEPKLPSSDGVRGRRFRNHRQVVEGINYRYRCGLAWRDLPADFGPWQTVWKRHRRFTADGTWEAILTAL
jgi:transposase